MLDVWKAPLQVLLDPDPTISEIEQEPEVRDEVWSNHHLTDQAPPKRASRRARRGESWWFGGDVRGFQRFHELRIDAIDDGLCFGDIIKGSDPLSHEIIWNRLFTLTVPRPRAMFGADGLIPPIARSARAQVMAAIGGS